MQSKFYNDNPGDIKTFTPEPPADSLLEPLGKSYSKDNQAKLVDVVERTQLDLVSFVGAGTSKPLGIVDWLALTKKLLTEKKDFFKAEYNDFITARSDEDWLKVNSKYGNKLPEIADQIKDTFDNSQEFYNRILQEMKAKNTRCTSTLIQLALAINTHLTTNFDTSLEAAYKIISTVRREGPDSDGPRLHYYSRISESRSDLRPDIYYLHADLDKKFVVLCQEEYKKLYEDSDFLQRELASFFNDASVIFVGFSFQDEHVDRCVTNVIARAGADRKHKFMVRSASPMSEDDLPPPHFLLTSVSNMHWQEDHKREGAEIARSLAKGERTIVKEADRMHRFFKNFENRGIYPIVYNDHTYIEELFEYVDQTRNAKEWQSTSTT